MLYSKRPSALSNAVEPSEYSSYVVDLYTLLCALFERGANVSISDPSLLLLEVAQANRV